MEENWTLFKTIFKSKRKEIWNNLKISSQQKKEEENNQKQIVYTGARFFLEKVLVYADPLTLYCSARLVNKKNFKKKKRTNNWFFFLTISKRYAKHGINLLMKKDFGLKYQKTTLEM